MNVGVHESFSVMVSLTEAQVWILGARLSSLEILSSACRGYLF